MNLSALFRHRNFLRLWHWILGLGLVAVLVYFFHFSPVPVKGYRGDYSPVIEEVMGTGTLEARVGAAISPQIQGRLAEIYVDQNDRVQSGQLLARLDQDEWQQQVAIALAALEAARAGVDRMKADQSRAQAIADQAQVDYQRITDLVASKVATASDLDKAREHLQVAEADLRRAQAGVIEAGHQVVTAERTLAYRQAQLEDTEIRSPYGGLIVNRKRDPGDVVIPGNTILELISTDEMWVSAWVDETAMACLAPSQPARVVFRAEPEQLYQGEVVRLGRQTDKETREFLVDVRVDTLPANWAVGQRAEVYIETARKERALTVPQELVRWRRSQPGVLVLDRGKARWQPVRLGLQGRNQVEVREGLEVGQIVVDPLASRTGQLKEGQRIYIP